MDLRYIKGASLLVSTDAVVASVDLRADMHQSECIFIVLVCRTVRYVFYVYVFCSVRCITYHHTHEYYENLTGCSSQPRLAIYSLMLVVRSNLISIARGVIVPFLPGHVIYNNRKERLIEGEGPVQFATFVPLPVNNMIVRGRRRKEKLTKIAARTYFMPTQQTSEVLIAPQIITSQYHWLIACFRTVQ